MGPAMRNARHVLVAAMICFPLAVSAETVVKCGAMEGYAYFYPSPFVQEDQQGFEENQVEKGAIAISLEGNQYDVAHESVNGNVYSAKEDGAKIVPLANTKAHFVLFVAFPEKAAEIYTYHKSTKTLTMLEHKYGALVTSSKLMVSQCE